MIRISCHHIALSEMSGLRAVNEYEAMVHPLDYEFDLVKNATYLALGVLTRIGTPWLYVVAARGDRELQLVPAVLFNFNWSEVPENWFVRLTEREDIEIVPVSLAKIDSWFEKYTNDEPDVAVVVNQEIENILKRAAEESSIKL